MELDVVEGLVACMVILLVAYLTAGWLSPPVASGPPSIAAESMAYSLKRHATIHTLLNVNIDFQQMLENFTRESGLSCRLYLYYANETIVCGGLQASSKGYGMAESSAYTLSFQPHSNTLRVLVLSDRARYHPGWTVTIYIGVSYLDGRLPRQGRVWVMLVNQSTGETICWGAAYRQNVLYIYTYILPNGTIENSYQVEVRVWGEAFQGLHHSSFQVLPGSLLQPPSISPANGRFDWWLGEALKLDNHKQASTWTWGNQKASGTVSSSSSLLVFPLNSSIVSPGFWVFESLGSRCLVYVHPFTVVVRVEVGG